MYEGEAGKGDRQTGLFLATLLIIAQDIATLRQTDAGDRQMQGFAAYIKYIAMRVCT